MAKTNLSSPARKPQEAPKGHPLTSVRVDLIEDLEHLTPLSRPEAESPATVATALDLVVRLRWGRTPDEWTEWSTGRKLPHYLRGLAELISEHRSDACSLEMETFIAEALEYAAVRVAIALDGPERRMARWRVSVRDVEDGAKVVTS